MALHHRGWRYGLVELTAFWGLLAFQTVAPSPGLRSKSGDSPSGVSRELLTQVIKDALTDPKVWAPVLIQIGLLSSQT